MQVGEYQLSIATPCDVDWDSLHGDENRRFCHQCNLFVYDMTVMNEDEQLDLIRMAQNKDRTCARIYKRKDGKVTTRDCPVGLRLQRIYKTVKLASWIVFTAIFTGGIFSGLGVLKAQLQVTLSQSFSSVTSQLGVLNAYPSDPVKDPAAAR